MKISEETKKLFQSVSINVCTDYKIKLLHFRDDGTPYVSVSTPSYHNYTDDWGRSHHDQCFVDRRSHDASGDQMRRAISELEAGIVWCLEKGCEEQAANNRLVVEHLRRLLNLWKVNFQREEGQRELQSEGISIKIEVIYVREMRVSIEELRTIIDDMEYRPATHDEMVAYVTEFPNDVGYRTTIALGAIKDSQCYAFRKHEGKRGGEVTPFAISKFLDGVYCIVVKK